jgi:hypothetical protein
VQNPFIGGPEAEVRQGAVHWEGVEPRQRRAVAR